MLEMWVTRNSVNQSLSVLHLRCLDCGQGKNLMASRGMLIDGIGEMNWSDGRCEGFASELKWKQIFKQCLVMATNCVTAVSLRTALRPGASFKWFSLKPQQMAWNCGDCHVPGSWTSYTRPLLSVDMFIHGWEKINRCYNNHIYIYIYIYMNEWNRLMSHWGQRPPHRAKAH